MPDRSISDAEGLPSGANYIRFAQWEGRVCIQKTYQPKLKAYPVRWPMSRVAAEAFMLKFLDTRIRDTRIRLPALLRQETGTLWLEYCPGKSLAETKPERLPDPSLWQALFSVLQGLWDVSWEALPQDIQPVLLQQEKILDCMLAWKTDGLVPPNLRPGCLCLGDVSLNNILYDGARLTLLDFECAHWGYRGYDIGQLLAVTEAAWAGKPVLSVVEQAFFRAIPDKADRRACLFWKEKLLPYCRSSRHGTHADE